MNLLIPGYLWISRWVVTKLRIPAFVHPKVESQRVGYSFSLCDYITIFHVPSSKVQASSYQTVKQFFTGNRQFRTRSYSYGKSKKQNTWRRFVIRTAFTPTSNSSRGFMSQSPFLSLLLPTLSQVSPLLPLSPFLVLSFSPSLFPFGSFSPLTPRFSLLQCYHTAALM